MKSAVTDLCDGLHNTYYVSHYNVECYVTIYVTLLRL